jgi:hypothetical protein
LTWPIRLECIKDDAAQVRGRGEAAAPSRAAFLKKRWNMFLVVKALPPIGLSLPSSTQRLA